MILLDNRAVLSLTGDHRFSFLQGLVTQDVTLLESGKAQLLYGAMLNPQGKIRFDFFLMNEGDRLLMDVPADKLQTILKTLSLYKLRAKVEIAEEPDYCVAASLVAENWMSEDPRYAALGYRSICPREKLVNQLLMPVETYHAHRLSFGVPEDADFIADKAYIAEYGLDQLNAVSFTKGCYVGQEIVARMKHRSTAKKAPYIIEVAKGESLPEPGTPLTLSGKKLGELRSHIGQQGLALVRQDKLPHAEAEIYAGDVLITHLTLPEWFTQSPETATVNS